MANNFGIGFVSTLTAHLNQALAQVQQQMALEAERKRNIANLMIKSGMDQGGEEGARMMAAGWTVLLDPKAKIEEPEKSKAWEKAAGIAHLTTQIQPLGQGQAGPPGSQILGGPPPTSPSGGSPDRGEHGPQTTGTPPSPTIDIASLLSQNQSTQPGGPAASLAQPSTSPTTGGPPLNLTPGAAAPAATPPPPPGVSPSSPTTSTGPATPPPGSQPDAGWYAVKVAIDKTVQAAMDGHAPNSELELIRTNAGKMHSMVNDAIATRMPFTDENLQRIFDEAHPTGARITATKEAATAKAAQSERMLRLKQQGDLALETAKQAFKEGASQVFLDDAQAQALGLPEGGYIDKKVGDWLAANHRATIAAGARVKAASTSAGTGIVKIVDETGNTVYALKSDAVGRQVPLGGGMETTVSRAEAGLQASKEIREKLKDPKVKAGLGAIAGRVTTMGQFIGGEAVPPELTELQTAMKGYILAAYGVHGLRNAKEANHDYESFLALKFSPANLSAALDGYDVILKGFASHRPTGKVNPPPGAAKTPDKNADPLKLFQ